MRALFFHLKAMVLNIITMFLNIFIRRNKKVWLFGAWMGLRFADNSRYLFQYLNENKDIYNIDKVVWITRKTKLCEQLREMGYTAEMANSFRGIYYHIKAGVHVVCNMAYTNNGYLGDINGNLSCGAIKIQLWHGFPIKSNIRTTSNRDYKRIHKTLLYKLSLPGRWTETQYVVSTSKDCTRRYKIWFNNQNLKTIECGYPRECECLKLMDSEQEVIEILNRYKKTVLYLPTFRSYPVTFEHPLEDNNFCDWLVEHDVLWIEKPHLASSMSNYFDCINDAISGHLLRLTGNFDVNVLLPIVSLVVTDYSSVSADAIYFDCPVVYYIPDFEEYCGSDRGLTDGFETVTYGPKVYSSTEMLHATKQCFDFTGHDGKKLCEIKNTLFDGRNFSYKQQVDEILAAISKKQF